MNDSNDKYRNLLFLVRSHSFSAILLVAGIAWTSVYIRSLLASTDTADLSQPTDMLFAGLALIISAVLAMPAVLERIPQKAYRVMLVVGIGSAAYFFMASTNSVLDEEQFLKDQAKGQCHHHPAPHGHSRCTAGVQGGERCVYRQF